MDNVVFTQLSIRELRNIFREELEQFHKLQAAQQPAKRDDTPGEAGQTYVSKKQAARLISVCASTIDNAARAGKLKRHYVGKSVRFNRVEVLALAKSHTNHKR